MVRIASLELNVSRLGLVSNLDDRLILQRRTFSEFANQLGIDVLNVAW